MAGYDVSSYTPGEGHQSFTAEGPVEGAVGGAGAAPAPVPAAETAAPAAKVVTFEVKAEPELPELQEQEGSEQESEAAPEVTGEPIALEIPSFIDAKHVTEERQGYVSEFARVVPEIGMAPETAQGLMDLAIDCAVQLKYDAPDQHTTAKDARSAMTSLYGEKTASDLIARAQKYVGGSEAMKTYLDKTGLGNDAGVLTALALAGAGWLRLSPTQAEGASKRLMATKEFAQGDKLTLVKLQMLSRIASRQEAQPSAGVTMGSAAGKANAARIEAAKSELATLAAKRNMTPEDRARWAQLVQEASR